MRIEITEVEIATLKQPFQALRVKQPEKVRRLSASIEQYGQLTPVVVLAKKDGSQELLDGYRRVAALQILGEDLVKAELWNCSATKAVVQIITRNQKRHWEAVEEAMLLRELRDGHQLSQREISRILGRNQSWVARRLSLLDDLTEGILGLVLEGKVSSWSASRVLAPMARAIPEHADNLCKALVDESLSTRDLSTLWRHYQQANKTQRQRLVEKPCLFLKALKTREDEKQTQLVREGPEGRWLHDTHIAGNIIKRLRRNALKAFHGRQGVFDRRVLMTAFSELTESFRLLEETIGGTCCEQAATGETRNDTQNARAGDRNTENLSSAEGIEGCGAPGNSPAIEYGISQIRPAPGGEAAPQGAVSSMPG